MLFTNTPSSHYVTSTHLLLSLCCTDSSHFTCFHLSLLPSLCLLQVGLEAYSEQHNALLGAVRAFQDRIQAYKQDFVQREVLVLRGFLQYLLGTLSNELSQVGDPPTPRCPVRTIYITPPSPSAPPPYITLPIQPSHMNCLSTRRPTRGRWWSGRLAVPRPTLIKPSNDWSNTGKRSPFDHPLTPITEIRPP